MKNGLNKFLCCSQGSATALRFCSLDLSAVALPKVVLDTTRSAVQLLNELCVPAAVQPPQEQR